MYFNGCIMCILLRFLREEWQFPTKQTFKIIPHLRTHRMSLKITLV